MPKLFDAEYLHTDMPETLGVLRSFDHTKRQSASPDAVVSSYSDEELLQLMANPRSATEMITALLSTDAIDAEDLTILLKALRHGTHTDLPSDLWEKYRERIYQTAGVIEGLKTVFQLGLSKRD